MKKQSRRMALCGIMTALGVVVMLMGGVIPLATFCSPALAGLVLLPLIAEAGKRMALGAYAAISLLSLLLSPDKEGALLFAFLGYYPVLKWTLDRIPSKALRLAAKLAVFNLAAGAMLLTMSAVLNMEAVMSEYAAMTHAMLICFAVLANVTLLVYDRLVLIMMALYLKRLRPRLMRSR